jgi:hypothetical protein
MKTAWFLFLIIAWASLLQSTSFARPSGQASQPTPSQSRSSTLGARPGGNDETQVRAEHDQTGGAHSEQDMNIPARVTKGLPNHPASVNPKPVPSRQARSVKTRAANNFRMGAPGNNMDFHQVGSGISTAAANKTVNRRSLPVPPPTVGALNGQQFKNGRNPGARLAISGGPAYSTRGTAAINGSNIKSKP